MTESLQPTLPGLSSHVSFAAPRDPREARTRSVRRVEYAHFPRACCDPGTGEGFTADRSASGLSMVTDSGVESGVLLRVTVRDLEDRIDLDALAEVAWCRATANGRYRIGLRIVAEARRSMRVVRPMRQVGQARQARQAAPDSSGVRREAEWATTA